MPSRTSQPLLAGAEPEQPAERRFPHCWTMFYRHGVNATLTKNFFFNGLMIDARDRAMKHCGIMGYKFQFLRPLLCDIEVEEGIQLGTHDSRTGQLKKEAI